MEKKFTHNGNEYAARTHETDELVQIGIFAMNNRRPYHLEIAGETIADFPTAAVTSEMTIEKLIDFAIEDFKRLVDEGFLKG